MAQLIKVQIHCDKTPCLGNHKYGFQGKNFMPL